MSTTCTLNLSCHVRTGPAAAVIISVNQTDYNFNLAPTINWVPSSSSIGAHTLSLDVVLTAPLALVPDSTFTYYVDMKIQVQGNDVLICGYNMPRGIFDINSQPVWNVPGWQPYDISRHRGNNALYQGPGSLQILDGQTVEFGGTIITPLLVTVPPPS